MRPEIKDCQLATRKVNRVKPKLPSLNTLQIRSKRKLRGLTNIVGLEVASLHANYHLCKLFAKIKRNTLSFWT